jgi:hypothetical protein
LIDHTDIFDPEGREYRRMVEAAAVWNKPVLNFVPETDPGGEWKSVATETLKELDARGPQEASKDDGWRFFSGKRKEMEL